MTIKMLYKDYFQKSRIFLYPALDIKRGTSIIPIKTYIQWEDNYDIKDQKLICLYHLRDDKEFYAFESKMLLQNKLFYDFKQLDDHRGIYVFDYSSYSEDWVTFVKGKYSKLSPKLKKKIIEYYKYIKGREKITTNLLYVDSYLHPSKYYETYSNILNIPAEDLKTVGELCDIPDFKEETLISNIKNIIIKPETYGESTID